MTCDQRNPLLAEARPEALHHRRRHPGVKGEGRGAAPLRPRGGSFVVGVVVAGRGRTPIITALDGRAVGLCSVACENNSVTTPWSETGWR